MSDKLGRKNDKSWVLFGITTGLLLLPLMNFRPVNSIEEIGTNNTNIGPSVKLNSSTNYPPKDQYVTKNRTITETIIQGKNFNITQMEIGVNNTRSFQSQGKNQSDASNNITSSISDFSGTASLRHSPAFGDFNGDGYGDKAIGVPSEDIDSNYDGVDDVSDAGVVHVIYGSANGLASDTALEDQLWRQGSQGMPGIPEERDNFGSSLASGDFNGDGIDDLAIGVPGEDIDLAVATPQNFDTSISSNLFTNNVGVVQIIYGSGQGLTFSQFPKQVWVQGMGNIPDFAEENDGFGSSLASGDFNGDGKDDLAIGIAAEDFGTEDQLVYFYGTGQVQVIYGSSFGLSPNTSNPNTVIGVQVWTQNSTDVEGDVEKYDHFGSSLTTGDFNGDNKDDLVIGVRDETIDGTAANGCEEPVLQTCQGAINVIYGSSQGLSANAVLADQYWQQGLNGLDDVAETSDLFGVSLSTGDFNGDGNSDLAIGAPGEKIASETLSVGKVHVIYGSSSGLS
ncbi:MAG TPA: FG-GAP repeat protein, partial [Nitrososphaeraceae archaeon]|nr:FG-GAP repeat protein [Nitrososphaeraceae archaeon]